MSTFAVSTPGRALTCPTSLRADLLALESQAQWTIQATGPLHVLFLCMDSPSPLFLQQALFVVQAYSGKSPFRGPAFPATLIPGPGGFFRGVCKVYIRRDCTCSWSSHLALEHEAQEINVERLFSRETTWATANRAQQRCGLQAKAPACRWKGGLLPSKPHNSHTWPRRQDSLHCSLETNWRRFRGARQAGSGGGRG